jgi:predicted DNA-binding antitoxin AbrB/MazE fold protein
MGKSGGQAFDPWTLVTLLIHVFGPRSIASACSVGFLERSMTLTIDAIYSNGVPKPTVESPLRDNQHVRLTVETIDETDMDREAAVRRLKAGIASIRFFSQGALPSREELHDRRCCEPLIDACARSEQAAERRDLRSPRRQPWGSYRTNIKPRSGDISIRSSAVVQTTRNPDDEIRNAAAPRLLLEAGLFPTAHAVGYVDTAAPRLLIGNTQRFARRVRIHFSSFFKISSITVF